MGQISTFLASYTQAILVEWVWSWYLGSTLHSYTVLGPLETIGDL